MKAIIYKLMIFLFIIPLLGFSNTPRGKYTKTKKASKTYEVNKGTTLNITNKYGKVDIITWNKNIIEIDVKITVSGNSEDKVFDKLNNINIEFEKGNNQVHATTHLKKSNSSWFSGNLFNWSSSSNLNLEINYTVKMPIENNLNVYNDYGSISLDELKGKANINCDYGKIIIGNLLNSENKININYTNHSVIDFMEKGKISADYSGFYLEKANNVQLNADYTNSKFGEVRDIKYNCDFGSLRVEETTNIDGNGDYLSVQIEKVNNSVDIDVSFGSLKIDLIRKGFTNVLVNASYTGVKLGIESEASSNINTEANYGSIKYYGDLFVFNKKIEKSNYKEYIGYFNNEKNTSNIQVSNEFGSIKLYQK